MTWTFVILVNRSGINQIDFFWLRWRSFDFVSFHSTEIFNWFTVFILIPLSKFVAVAAFQLYIRWCHLNFILNRCLSGRFIEILAVTVKLIKKFLFKFTKVFVHYTCLFLFYNFLHWLITFEKLFVFWIKGIRTIPNLG